MKITDISYETYRIPYTQSFTSGRGSHRAVIHTFIKISTDEGITGIGVGRTVNGIELIKPLLIGEDPMCIEKLVEKMKTKVLKGHQYIQAISAIDVALWDIKAKVASMPLYKLLGGARENVGCYVAGGYYAKGKTVKDLQAEMEKYLSWGVKAVKIKVGGLTIKEDALRVGAVRETVGDDCKILLDAGGAWRANEAIEFAKRVEEYYPCFLEEPCANSDIEGMKKVACHSSVPLAAGEEALWKDGARDLIDSGAISFIQPDATLSGGITDVLKIGAYADMKHIYISPHGIQQLHVHLNCAMPNAVLTEYYPRHFDWDYYINPVDIGADGNLTPPNAPGASLDYDPEVLKEFRVG